MAGTNWLYITSPEAAAQRVRMQNERQMEPLNRADELDRLVAKRLKK